MSQLVLQDCRCSLRCCFKQFAGEQNEAAVSDARASLHGLDPNEREPGLCLVHDLQCFFFIPHSRKVISALSMRSKAFGEADAIKQLFACRPQGEGLSLAAKMSAPTSDDLESDVEEGQELLASDVEEAAEVLVASDLDSEPGEAESTHARPRRAAGDINFLGKKVCVHALSRLLSVGSSILSKLRAGQTVFCGRKTEVKHPTLGVSLEREGLMWQSVLRFFWHLYHSAAEVLPISLSVPRGQQAESPFPDDPADDTATRFQHDFLRSLDAYCNSPEATLHTGPGTFAGPARCLQHSSRTELFWEYVAACESSGETPASYNTFMKMANKIMKPGQRGNFLRFRKKGDHAQCDTCSFLKQEVRRSRSIDGKKAACARLSAHLLSQWQDRQIYWSFRALSHTWFQMVKGCVRMCFGKMFVLNNCFR